jgi:hypothetical protein
MWEKGEKKRKGPLLKIKARISILLQDGRIVG